MLDLIPFLPGHLAALTALQPEGPDPAALEGQLTDGAHGGGAQVVVAVEQGRPCGVTGWVSLGVETEGIVYGSPLLAETEEAAALLLDHLATAARALGARQLRVSRFPLEAVKARAMAKQGFRPLLDMISMERPSRGLPEGSLPAFLERVPFQELDWEKVARAFNVNFATVPNAPPLDAGIARETWEESLDPEASQMWEDRAGNYLAWIGIQASGYVDEVGVEASLRGKGVAAVLYRNAAEVLAARGVERLSTLLAGTNQATLRIHEKLGFREYARRTVCALDLQDPGQEG